MTPARPFTCDTLADRWGCSAETIRQMVVSGRLPGFRVGRMIPVWPAFTGSRRFGEPERTSYGPAWNVCPRCKCRPCQCGRGEGGRND